MRHAQQSAAIGHQERHVEQDRRTETVRSPAGDGAKSTQRAFVENRLLVRLGEASRSELAPLLQPVDLPVRTRIVATDVTGRHYCHFLLSGLASCALIDRRRERVEVAVVGREGAVGLAAVGGRDAETRTVMLAPGAAVKVDRADLLRLSARSPEIAVVLHSACADLLHQSAGSLLAAARYGVGQRVARWLLIATERAQIDTIPVTHETIAMSLGVRRAGVSHALNALRTQHAIEYSRRAIAVLDRERLIEASGGSYVAVEFETTGN